MEMNAAITNSMPLANAGQSSGTGKTQGSADGSTNPFGSLLQATADGGSKNDTATSDAKKATDPLLTLLMAITGGLTPAMLAQMQIMQPNADPGTADSAKSAGPVVQVNLGGQTLPISLQNLGLTNGQLAMLLQASGASPALLNNLLANPQGQPSQLLVDQPGLLPDFTQAMNQAVQSALTHPQLTMQDPQATNLLKAVLAQLTVSSNRNANSSAQPNCVSGKQASALGKLQATFSAHLLQTTAEQAPEASTATVTAQTTAMGQTPAQALNLAQAIVTAGTTAALSPTTGGQKQQQQQPTDAPSASNASLLGNMAILAPLQQQSQAPLPATVAPVVLMQANQFQNEFQDLIVKRAAYIENPGSQEFRIVLQPQGLGQIEVHVQASGNQLSLHFAADSAQAKGLLDSGLAGLKSQLEAQGIRFDRIEVTTASNNGGFNSGLQQDSGSSGQSFQRQSGGQSQKRAVNDPFTLEGVLDATTDEAMLQQTTPDGIDVTA